MTPTSTAAVLRPAQGHLARLRFPALGAVVTLTTPAAVAPTVEAAIRGVFQDADQRFSPWRGGGEAQRVACGALSARDASPEFRAVYDLATAWRFRTRNAWTPRRRAVVSIWRGWHGFWRSRKQADSSPGEGNGEAPLGHRGGMRALVTVRAPRHGQGATPSLRATVDGSAGTLRQVSVLAPDTVTAGMWATAILAGGVDTLQLAATQQHVDVLGCGVGGEVWSTPAFRSVPPAA